MTAQPEAADGLAQWREEAERLLDEVAAWLVLRQPIASADHLQALRRHLAAIPAPPDVETESVAGRHHREVRIRKALDGYRNSPGGLDDMDTAARTVLRELRSPPDVNKDLLEALERYESLEGVLSTEDVIFMNIQVERRRQRGKWGDEHDAEHTPEEWQALIVERMARPLPALEDDAYRVRLVEVAAIAVAALEARAIAQAEGAELAN